MKAKRFAIATHALVWVLLLVIPYISTDQVFRALEQKSRISVEMLLNNGGLQLNVMNNKVKVQRDIFERSGLGIVNTNLRLNLIYPSRHLLVINETEKDFFVYLHINLQ